MILSVLYNIDELNKMSDGIIVYHKDCSFLEAYMFSTEEIKSIKEKTDKPVFLSILPLYHNSEIEKVKEVIKELKDLDGFFFQDEGLIDTFISLNIIDKAIYSPGTFITNHLDKEYFKECGLKNFLISREITLNDIKTISSLKEDVDYSYVIFGYQNMFYSLRKHFLNFDKHYNHNYDLKNRFDVSIKEETRNEYYKAIEDKFGFRIYRDKAFNGYPYLKDFDQIKYLILRRSFVSDEMYFNTINLYLGNMDILSYDKLYKDLCDAGFLFKEIGLLKGEENE